MIAKRLESLLAVQAHRSEPEMLARFQKLRDNGLLPKSRGKNAEALTAEQIAVSILSLVPSKTGYAGLGALILRDLRPVGGVDASFAKARTLGEAIVALIEAPEQRARLLELRVSDDEISKNARGLTALRHREGDGERVAYFVHKTALTLMQKGAERTFDPGQRVSAVATETSFLPPLFERIARELADEGRPQATPDARHAG